MKKNALTDEELKIVQHIMRNYPNTLIFCSRTKGTNKRFSDLDVCIKDPVDSYDYELLKEAVELSDLPFLVDLVPYKRCNDSFKKIIEREGINLAQLFLQA